MRRPRLSLVIATVAAVLAGSCSGSGRSTPALPVGQRLNVAASFFPLAEIARRVGLSRVTVTDLTPPGADPRGVSVDPAAVDNASVVLLVGRGFQPAVERAAAARPPVALGGDDPWFWLDPLAMENAIGPVVAVLARADPAGNAAYRSAGRAFAARLGALDIDYRSSLVDCARHDLVTADGAFGRVAARYGLTAHVVGEPGLVGLVKARGVTTIFTEPSAPSGAARDLARVDQVKIDSLDTIEAEDPAGASYLDRMTANLAELRRALACPSGM